MSLALDVASTSSGPIEIPPLTPEEEDQIIHVRITNDERPLRRVVKKFHNWVSSAHPPLVPLSKDGETSEDAKEAFLVELASFQLALQKNAMICEAETRQVEEYHRERIRIENEREALRGQIEQLKTSLEYAQMLRRRKMEYDQVAEKVNTLSSRDELEQSIQDLENDMLTIRAEHETQSKSIQTQKAALDAIIGQLGTLRFLTKEQDADTTETTAPSPAGTPAPEAVLEDESQTAPSTDEKPAVSSAPADDIEMGEVEEEVKGEKKKKREEEMEEGEATDLSSVLSDPPDDI